MNEMDETAKTPRRRPGLLVQIAVALALVGLLPLGLAVWQLVGVNKDALFDQLLRTHTVAARTASETVDAYLEVRRALADALIGDPVFAADPTAPEAQRRIADSLSAWTRNGVVAVVLVDDAGQIVLRVQARDQAERVDRALELPDLLAGPHLFRDAGTAWATIPRPLEGTTGSLILVADAEAVARALVPDELGEQAQLLLVDRAGGPVWGTTTGTAGLPRPLVEAALSGQLAGAGRYTDPAGAEIVAAWAAADAGRWVAISLQPGRIAQAAAVRMARRSGIAVAASIALVALISMVAWRSFVRPLRRLLSAQRAARDGGGEPEAAVSETQMLQESLAELEKRAEEKSELDQIFLGRYQVRSHLGSGGMGSVYRGWDPRLQRDVALKTIRIAVDAEREDRVSKLLDEAVAAAQVTHPNVVAVYDAEERGGAAFVAMEFVDGIGLDRYLESRGRLDWREVVPLGQAIAAGLAAAHARDLVHRDIKPGNVLLGHDGSIKIADFGLAAFLQSLEASPGKVFGTPGFLAPEALQGLPIDHRSDLFALGVVLYRALSGRYPVRGTSYRELVLATVREPAPRPEEIENAPPELAVLVSALLEKDPATRLAPASTVAERFADLARERQLTWRLDFTPTTVQVPKGLVTSATLPTVRLDADLA